jgi:DNA-binding response OmpR family regulator
MAVAVLSGGRDPLLLTMRNEVLSRYGCVVTEASSPNDLVNLFFAGDYDLLLLCHSIPAEERRCLLWLAHKFRPSLTVIVVTDTEEYRHRPRQEKRKVDQYLKIPPYPDALVRAVTSAFPRLSLSA